MKYRKEFVDEVERQIEHNTLKKDYLEHKLESVLYDEPAQTRAKAKLELDALIHKIEELQLMFDWLNGKS